MKESTVQKQNRPNWTSRYSFILASIGSAVGLGNIWRFPYIMGQNGGAVFLVVYLFLILTLCFIPLIVELSVGKMQKKESVGAYENINPKFKFFGFLNPITGVLISSFYFVVGGWILNYIYLSVINHKIQNCAEYFSNFIQNPTANCMLSIIFLFLCIFFSARGIKRGIELVNNILMPIFLILLIILIIFSLNLPNAELGLEYMFKPDFSKVNSHMFLSALGQALFTLSVGMGALLTYGSYLKEDKNIAKSAYAIIISDTTFAILAGIMIFPAIYSFNLESTSGPGLTFVTLPKIFSVIPFGNTFSLVFFLLLFCVALTSGISILEPAIATLIERYNFSRIKASMILFLIIGVLSIPTSLSLGLLSGYTILGKTLFDFLDFITSNLLLPFNTLVLCIIAGWFLKMKGSMYTNNKFLSTLFDIGLKYVIPPILILLLYLGLK